MSLKLKVLGLGILAVLATGAFAVMNASATVNGHFTHDAADGHATIVGNEIYGTAHMTEFQRTEPTDTPVGAPITCTKTTYHGTVTTNTVQTLTIVPHYTECGTTGGTWNEVTVTMNGCDYTFHSNTKASTNPPTEDATVTIDCPPGQAIVIHHPNCTITVPAQAPKGGVTYTTVLENNKHALTVDVTVTHIVGQFHGGLCVFLGTTKEFDMTGSVTVKGENTVNQPVNITAT